MASYQTQASLSVSLEKVALTHRITVHSDFVVLAEMDIR
jgi:hypothetical protein